MATLISSRRQLAILLGVLLVVAGAWLAPLDAIATRHVEAALKRALVSFASARALNAVISVVQGTEVSVQLAGLGPTFTPGQVLDPINDLVEQFSTMMLLAAVSFGVQLILIKFGSYWAVSLALTAAAAAWAWRNWRQSALQVWPTRLLVGLLLVRFAVPAVVVGSEWGFELLLADRYKAAQQEIELSVGRLTSLSTPAVEPKAGESLAERFKRWLSQGADVVKEVAGRIEKLGQLAADMVEHIVMLIAVFVVQTMVIPLLLLWVLIGLGRAVVARSLTRVAGHPCG